MPGSLGGLTAGSFVTLLISGSQGLELGAGHGLGRAGQGQPDGTGLPGTIPFTFQWVVAGPGRRPGSWLTSGGVPPSSGTGLPTSGHRELGIDPNLNPPPEGVRSGGHLGVVDRRLMPCWGVQTLPAGSDFSWFLGSSVWGPVCRWS